jgi:hypothetical protein
VKGYQKGVMDAAAAIIRRLEHKREVETKSSQGSQEVADALTNLIEEIRDGGVWTDWEFNEWREQRRCE